ncbi:MAG: CHAP domain-containing protein [Pseudomonadota bacterium]
MFLIAVALSLSIASEETPPAHVECVPIARQQSGIQIYGDARTWWDQADGRYVRGNTPKPGAVLTFKPHGAMTLGHVAAVSKVIDERNILVTHANWSPINGRRGQVERNVRVIDVSENGDWSRVRVWYAPLEDLGTTAWPVHGFIYPAGTAPKPMVPRLQYASMLTFEPGALNTAAAVRPTGRLAYLGKMLERLK